MNFATAKNQNGFKQVISEIIGCPMTRDEMFSEFTLFGNGINHDNFLENEVYEKAKMVLNDYSQNSDSLSLLTLTYILDPEDLIDDNIKYFGLMDDLFILDAYLMLKL